MCLLCSVEPCTCPRRATPTERSFKWHASHAVNIHLPASVHKALNGQGRKLGLSKHDMARVLLTRIVRDNLVDAILDGEVD